MEILGGGMVLWRGWSVHITDWNIYRGYIYTVHSPPAPYSLATCFKALVFNTFNLHSGRCSRQDVRHRSPHTHVLFAFFFDRNNTVILVCWSASCLCHDFFILLIKIYKPTDHNVDCWTTVFVFPVEIYNTVRGYLWDYAQFGEKTWKTERNLYITTKNGGNIQRSVLILIGKDILLLGCITVEWYIFLSLF